MARLFGISLVSIPFASSPASAKPNFSLEMIAKCHEKVIQVFSDALGENETVEQYRKEIHCGIDCVQTDHPLRALRAISLMAAKKAR
jgi:hypothetical protein